MRKNKRCVALLTASLLIAGCASTSNKLTSEKPPLDFRYAKTAATGELLPPPEYVEMGREDGTTIYQSNLDPHVKSLIDYSYYVNRHIHRIMTSGVDIDEELRTRAVCVTGLPELTLPYKPDFTLADIELTDRSSVEKRLAVEIGKYIEYVRDIDTFLAAYTERRNLCAFRK